VRISSLLIALAVVAAACSGSPTSVSAPSATSGPATSTSSAVASTSPQAAVVENGAPPEHRIGVRVVDGEGEFYDRVTDETFIVRGVNYVFLERPNGDWVNEPFDTFGYDPDLTRADFRRIADAGFTTVRMFFDHCSGPPGCITSPDRTGVDPAYLDNVADVIDAAAETGLFLLLTSNDIPDHGGYGEAANRQAGEQFAGYRNAHYLTAAGHEAAAAYWSDFMTGLVDRGARLDHVFGWSLLNEQWLFGHQVPLSLSAGLVTAADGVTYDMADPEQKAAMVANNLNRYATLVHDVITDHDPTALVTMGFFAPQFPNATAIGGDWYVDTVGYIEGGAPLDFYDFHAYPGEDIPLHQLAENFGVHLLAEKPVVMGEYGAFIHRYGELTTATRAISDWIVQSCSLGFDGWIYWSYRTNPNVEDKTWSLTSEDGFLLDALAPIDRTDPCVPIAVETDNLAFGAAVTASRSLDGQAPELAVDENEATQWGAGVGPLQWFEIDLGEPRVVAEIRLLVAQFPAGDTRHRILVDRGSGFEDVHAFAGITDDGDWLGFVPEPPLAGVRRVRIETVSSPSWVAWREIEINGS